MLREWHPRRTVRPAEPGSYSEWHPRSTIRPAEPGSCRAACAWNSGERLERRVVVGFVLDFGDELAVQNGVVLVEHDHRACRDALERAARQRDAVRFEEVGTA